MLRRPEPLEALLAALEGVERLVLLGDIVELLEGRPRQAMEVAEPVLRALGARLGARGEVIVVPGNHDRGLVRPWLHEHDVTLRPRHRGAARRHARARAAGLLARRRRACASTTRASGSRTRVWATHGHYLDRHLLPESAYGFARGLLGRLPRDGAVPADYERAGGPSATRLEALLTRWLPRPLAVITDELTELLRAATMPGGPRRAARPPARAARRADAGRADAAREHPGAGRVVHRLGVEADWVVFGHVHRCGPLAGDDPRQWRGPGGSPSIANTGSWVYEPLLLHHVSAPHPYWPGGAIRLSDGGAPEADRAAGPPRRRDAPRPAPRLRSVAELEDDLAGRAALVDDLQRLGRALEREALADDRPDEALVGQAGDLGADLAIAVGLAQHVGAPAGADDLDVVEQQPVDRTSGIEPPVKPTTTARPPSRSERRLSVKRSPPTGSRTTSTPPPESSLASSFQAPSERTTSSAPASRATRSFSSLETTAIVRAPSPLATCSDAVPTPPAAPCTSTVSPAAAARGASARSRPCGS